jgi:hypothetical protein
MEDATCECDSDHHADRILWLLSRVQTPSQIVIDAALQVVVAKNAPVRARALIDSEKPPSQDRINLVFETTIDEYLLDSFSELLKGRTGPSWKIIKTTFEMMVQDSSDYNDMLESLMDAKKSELQPRICHHLRQSIATNDPDLAQVLCRYAPLDLVKELLEASDPDSDACRAVREALLD